MTVTGLSHKQSDSPDLTCNRPGKTPMMQSKGRGQRGKVGTALEVVLGDMSDEEVVGLLN